MTGLYFGDFDSDGLLVNTVTLDGIPCAVFAYVDANTITCTAGVEPTGLGGTGEVAVTVDGVSSGTSLSEDCEDGSWW